MEWHNETSRLLVGKLTDNSSKKPPIWKLSCALLCSQGRIQHVTKLHPSYRLNWSQPLKKQAFLNDWKKWFITWSAIMKHLTLCEASWFRSFECNEHVSHYKETSLSSKMWSNVQLLRPDLHLVYTHQRKNNNRTQYSSPEIFCRCNQDTEPELH